MSGESVGAAERVSIHRSLIRHFAVLRRPQNDRDVTDIRLPPEHLARFGLLPGQTRMVELPGAARVWIVPGSLGAFLAWEKVPALGRAGTVASVGRICIHGLWGLSEDPGGNRWLVGLVPDGNDQVTLVLRDGSKQSLETVEGVVVITQLEPVHAIEFRDFAGAAQHQLC